MSSKNNQFSIKTVSTYAFILSFSFVFIGIFEIINNLVFKWLHAGNFPGLLFTHFLPIVALYVLKSLTYVGLFLVFVAVTLLIQKIILMFVEKQEEKKKTVSERLSMMLTILYDLFVPLMLISILFFQYESGPATLSYYFYFLSDSISQTLKSLLEFGTLNTVIKTILALLIAGVFITFRISRYARFYIAFLLFLMALVVLPNLVFLLHHFAGVLPKILLMSFIVILLVFALFVLRQLFTLGIRRWLEIALVLLVLVSIAGNVYFFTATQNRQLNIVFIVLDTLRMKSFNENTMPFLYELKDEAVYFPNSYSSSDNTVTSHNAIYYGKYPSNVGLEHGPFPATTMMEVLRSHGYRTVVVSANGRFCIVNGFDKGVEDFYESWKEENHVRTIQLMTDYGLSEQFKIIDSYFNYYVAHVVNKPRPIDKKPLGHREYRYFNYEPAEVVNEFVKTAIHRNPPSDPLHLFVNYLDPHTPYLAPTPNHIAAVVERLKTDVPDIYEKLHFDKIAATDTLIFRQIMLMWQQVDSLTDKSLKDDFLTFCYEENLRYLDERLRELFSWFEAEGLTENTLFIITSDHGESLGEHGLYEHGNKRLYNPEIHVPLMMLFPDKLKPVIQRNVIEIGTQSIDFFPTLVDLLGIKTNVKLNGQSVLPFIFDAADSSENDYAISEYTNVRAITDFQHKLIVRQGAVELYDLVNDPEEENNLVALRPDVVRALNNKMDELLKSEQVVSKSRLSEESENSRYDPETLKLLKTLGYVK